MRTYGRWALALALVIALVAPAMAATKAPTGEPPIGSLAYLDYKYGFRDLKFGDAPTADMKLLGSEGARSYYTRLPEDLELGGATLNDIGYIYYKGKLMGIVINAKASTNSDALLATASAAFGPGLKRNPYVEEYLWGGRRVNARFVSNSYSHDSSFTLASLSISTEEAADNLAAAKGGAKNW